MKLLLFILLTSHSSFVSSQDDLKKSLSDFMQISGTPACESTPESTMICTKDDTAPVVPSQRLIYRVTNLNQIPSSVREEIPLPDGQKVSPRTPLYLSLWHDNDNILFDSIKGGNDFGYTTGLNLEIGGVNSKGLTFGGHLYTGLYTKRVIPVSKNGKKSFKNFTDWNSFPQSLEKDEVMEKHPQGTQFVKFQEETLIGAFVNNEEQGTWLLWNVEGGLSRLQGKKTNPYLATGIQHGWHKLLGLVNYEYVPDDKDIQYSAYLKGIVGAQKELLSGRHCSFNVRGDAGFSVDTSGEKSFLVGEVDLDLGLIAKKKSEEKLLHIRNGIEKNMGTLNQTTLKTGFDINFHHIIITNQLLIPLGSGYMNGIRSPHTDKDPIHRIGIIVPLRK